MTREDNLLCVRRRKFTGTTDSRHNLPIYPNLAGQITRGKLVRTSPGKDAA